MKVTPKALSNLLPAVLRSGLVPMIHGSPGIGKSDIIRATAEAMNLKVVDVRLSQCDPTDLNGFPSTQGDKATYKPMDHFLLEGEPLPEGYSGVFIFFDEINHAPRAVRKAAYKVLLDKMIGNHKLHEKVFMGAAGNLESDGAAVEPTDTALQSRMCHFELEVSAKDWLEWAQLTKIDHRITSYIEMRPGSLQLFSPDHNDKTFACPRTWQDVHKTIAKSEELEVLLPVICGSVSEGAGREFYQFTRVYKDLPDFKQILANPMSAHIPDSPSERYALSGVLADNASAENATALLTFVDRLPVEFQIITVRDMSRRCPAVTSNPKWAQKAVELSQHM